MGVDLFVVPPKMLLHSSLQVGTFDPTKKKKKKKKVRIQDDEETGENIEKVTEKVETLAVADGLDSAFLGLKKKKKKKLVEGDFAEEENAESLVVVQGTAFQFVSAIPLYSNLHMVFSYISSVLVRGLLGINMFGFAGVTLEVCIKPKENPRRQLMN